MSISEWHELFNMLFVMYITLSCIAVISYYALKVFAVVTYRLAHNQKIVNTKIQMRREILVNV